MRASDGVALPDDTLLSCRTRAADGVFAIGHANDIVAGGVFGCT